MRHFDTESLFESEPHAAFMSFANADELQDFMPGVISSDIATVSAEDELGPLDFEVDVRVGLSFFSGRMRAAVAVERESRSVRVKLLNGPVKSAQAHVKIEPREGGCRVAVSVDYQEPIGPLDLLIGRFQERVVARVLSAYAERAKALQSSN